MKKLLCVICALALGFCFCAPTNAEPADNTVSVPSLSAKSAILINADDGSVYFESNADERMGPASTTKLMTALVALEHAQQNMPVKVPSDAVGIEGSSVYLIEGETLTLYELICALLLSSANDAAAAIAITVGGSIEGFCALMNEKAAEMGLRDTHFTNPHGLHDEEHYTTARELAKIAAHALSVPTIREIVSKYKMTIPHDGCADARLLVNHNKLLRSYDGCIGMKTGFTKKTGRTLVSAAEREGLTLIAVTLNAPDDWRDHAALLDYGFERYTRVIFANAGEYTYELPVVGGTEECIALTNSEPLSLVLPKDHASEEYLITSTSRFLYAPTELGYSPASVTVVCDGKSVTSPLAVSSRVLSSTPKKKGFFHRITSFFTLEQ